MSGTTEAPEQQQQQQTWKQPKCLSTDEQIKTHTHTHTHTMLLSYQKNEIMLFAETWKDLEIIILSEVKQRKTSII